MNDERSDEEKFADVAFAIQADAARMTKELAAKDATIAAQAADLFDAAMLIRIGTSLPWISGRASGNRLAETKGPSGILRETEDSNG
jgi:hypothetical protein